MSNWDNGGNEIKFAPLFPDVLGVITGGSRISMAELQVALGIFPRQAYINQPIEVILVLQNMIDQPLAVKVAVRTPTEDKKGRPVVIAAAKPMVSIGMKPGEVGLLRVPIVPQPPTQPGTKFPVRVAVRYRAAGPGMPVRSPGGGAPPSVLSLSQFKLQALREVTFDGKMWGESADIITAFFDVAPKRLPPTPQDMTEHYETLWSHEAMRKEVQQAFAQVEAARRVAANFSRPVLYNVLREITTERFAARGLVLHPGEASAIAKMITYTVDEAPTLEPNYNQEDRRWFQTLCQVLAHDPDLEDAELGDMIEKYLYEAALFDATLLAFSVVNAKVRENLGDKEERLNYTNRLLNWLAGYGSPDLTYVYLPLALGGVAINRLVSLDRYENPWIMLQDLQEAAAGRRRLLSGEASVIFDMLKHLSDEAMHDLRVRRIDPP